MLHLPPRAVVFEFATWGKPQLAERQNPAGLAFNVSHSGDWGVIALGWRRTLGVDLETADPGLDHTGLARRFFSDDEQRQLAALPAELRTAGFYRVWTGKEAYLKATGLGMSFPLGSFAVAADPRLPPRLLAVADRPEEPRRWTAAAFTPADNVFGTVMWDGGPATIHRWTWSGETGSSEVRLDDAG
jgi:4'-phosphopantetheinyl transferase